MDSTNAPTPSSPAKHKLLPLNYTDVNQPDAPIAPPPIELNMVVHNQPQKQQYSIIGPSNPLGSNVQVDEEEYSELNHDVHAKSIQSIDSEGYERLQHPHTDFSIPQSTEGEHPTERKSPKTSEDFCYCHFITSYNYLLHR